MKRFGTWLAALAVVSAAGAATAQSRKVEGDQNAIALTGADSGQSRCERIPAG